MDVEFVDDRFSYEFVGFGDDLSFIDDIFIIAVLISMYYKVYTANGQWHQVRVAFQYCNRKL